MAIDKDTLFQTTVALWPEPVDLSNGLQVLHDVYCKNEQAFPVDDNWRQVALWSFHQILWGNAKRALAAGRSTIFPGLVRAKTFDKWMLLNLSGHECWSAERAEYEQSANG